MKYLSNFFKNFNTAKIKFPIITLCYLLFVLILNLVVKYNYSKKSDGIPELYKKLYDYNLGFLIPVINNMGAAGILNNKKHSTADAIFYAFFGIIIFSSIIEYRVGHIALILFIFNAILYKFYVDVTHNIQSYDKKNGDMYPGESWEPINISFNTYECCGSGIYTNLLACALITLYFTTNNKLYKIIILLLAILVPFIFFIVDYNTFNKNYKNNKNYKKNNIIIIRLAFSWHFMFYLLGLISSTLFFLAKKK